MMKFKEVADALAKEQGLTNTEVAEMIGMSKANYSHEKGHNDNLSLYLKVCGVLGAKIYMIDSNGLVRLGRLNLDRLDKYLSTYVKSRNTALIVLRSVEETTNRECFYSVDSKSNKTYNFTTINK